jgi:hypothetical protein
MNTRNRILKDETSSSGLEKRRKSSGPSELSLYLGVTQPLLFALVVVGVCHLNVVDFLGPML